MCEVGALTSYEYMVSSSGLLMNFTHSSFAAYCKLFTLSHWNILIFFNFSVNYILKYRSA